MEYSPGIFVVVVSNLVTIKRVKRRQPLNEDVFGASVLCFSSSPSKDTTISTFCVFSSLFVKVSTFSWLFSPSKTWFQISLSVCSYIHWMKDISQAIIGTFLVPFSNMVGLVTLEVSLRFMMKFKPFKMWRPVSLFILLWFLFIFP